MNRLRQLISADNLERARLGNNGQMATMLLLLLVGILILALALSNLGRVSVTATLRQRPESARRM